MHLKLRPPLQVFEQLHRREELQGVHSPPVEHHSLLYIPDRAGSVGVRGVFQRLIVQCSSDNEMDGFGDHSPGGIAVAEYRFFAGFPLLHHTVQGDDHLRVHL